MAEEQRARETEAEESQGEKKGLNVKTMVLVGIFVVLQAVLTVVIVWAFKGATGTGPQKAEANQAVEDEPQFVIVPALPNTPSNKIVAVNAQRGQLVYWALKVSLRVPVGQEEHLKERLIANEDLIKEKINTVIRACDPTILEQEADHATLKRQIRFALNSILGKGTISEVVIPECIPQKVD